jgi:hypothetical protein
VSYQVVPRPRAARDAYRALAPLSPAVNASLIMNQIVGLGAAGVGRVRSHSGYVGGWNQTLAVVAAFVQEQLPRSG